MNRLLRFTLAIPCALAYASGLQAQNPPSPVTVTPRLDTPQARVIVAQRRLKTSRLQKNCSRTRKNAPNI